VDLLLIPLYWKEIDLTIDCTFLSAYKHSQKSNIEIIEKNERRRVEEIALQSRFEPIGSSVSVRNS
jgi:hypothetical protein